MAGIGLTERQLQALARKVDRRIARQLIAALTKARAGVPLNELEKAIIARNFDAVADALGLKEVVIALKDAQTATAVVRDQAWLSVLAQLPASVAPRQLAALTIGKYARQSPRVMEAIKRQNLTRIQGIRQETTVAIRQTLTRSLAQGIPPAETARLIRSMVGLNKRQAGAVRGLRQRLQGLDLDQATIDRRVERYAQQQLNHRATVIARTETMTALASGKRLQQERLVKDGVIQSSQWENEWVTADDGDRVCEICEPLHGVRVAIGESFDSVVGQLSGPPAHPQCRCLVRMVLKGFRAGQAPSAARRAILKKSA